MPEIEEIIPCLRFGETSVRETKIAIVEANRCFAICTGRYADAELVPVASCGDYWNGIRWLKAHDPKRAEEEANLIVRALAERRDDEALREAADSLAMIGWPIGTYAEARRQASAELQAILAARDAAEPALGLIHLTGIGDFRLIGNMGGTDPFKPEGSTWVHSLRTNQVYFVPPGNDLRTVQAAYIAQTEGIAWVPGTPMGLEPVYVPHP
jgi:hypothetical protein